MLIAADGGSLTLLQEEFPDLETIHFPGYRMRYSGNRTMNLQVFSNVPKIFYQIYIEHRRLKKLITKHQLDAVISDNRYGLWSKKTYCVFLTHQVSILCPSRLKFLEPILEIITGFFIGKYDRCWVPDVKDTNNLSGDLSHRRRLPSLKFIGPLSRFANANGVTSEKKFDLMVTLSGPEPQRSIFEKLIMGQLDGSKLNSIIVRGLPGKSTSRLNGMAIHNHLNSEKMYEAMLSSDVVLSRPGYSTIMDLAAVGKKAVFVPTPGQTEQEYLAKTLKERGLFYSDEQDEFDLELALAESNKYSGIKFRSDPSLLKDAVQKLLSRI
ncbi:MAG: glycosyltransferase [Flavobacteriales bacterium]|nr:glycosyltransferase [Flavobacteriales bacterium]